MIRNTLAIRGIAYSLALAAPLSLAACSGQPGDAASEPGSVDDVELEGEAAEEAATDFQASESTVLAEVNPEPHHTVQFKQYDDETFGVLHRFAPDYEGTLSGEDFNALPVRSLADTYLQFAGEEADAELWTQFQAFDEAVADAAAEGPALETDDVEVEVPDTSPDELEESDVETLDATELDAETVTKSCNHTNSFWNTKGEEWTDANCVPGVNFPVILCEGNADSIDTGWKRAHIMRATVHAVDHCKSAHWLFRTRVKSWTGGIAKKTWEDKHVQPRETWWYEVWTTHNRTDMRSQMANEDAGTGHFAMAVLRGR